MQHIYNTHTNLYFARLCYAMPFHYTIVHSAITARLLLLLSLPLPLPLLHIVQHHNIYYTLQCYAVLCYNIVLVLHRTMLTTIYHTRYMAHHQLDIICQVLCGLNDMYGVCSTILCHKLTMYYMASIIYTCYIIDLKSYAIHYMPYIYTMRYLLYCAMSIGMELYDVPYFTRCTRLCSRLYTLYGYTLYATPCTPCSILYYTVILQHRILSECSGNQVFSEPCF